MQRIKCQWCGLGVVVVVVAAVVGGGGGVVVFGCGV